VPDGAVIYKAEAPGGGATLIAGNLKGELR
jgi:hypothetical protein